MTPTTSWMMIVIRLDVRNSDSRRYSSDEFNDIELITRDTKEELLAYCYGLHESNKRYEPSGSYDTGTRLNFYGPFEVMNNDHYTCQDGTVEQWFEDSQVLNEDKVKEAIASGAVLHQIMK